LSEAKGKNPAVNGISRFREFLAVFLLIWSVILSEAKNLTVKE